MELSDFEGVGFISECRMVDGNGRFLIECLFNGIGFIS